MSGYLDAAIARAREAGIRVRRLRDIDGRPAIKIYGRSGGEDYILVGGDCPLALEDGNPRRVRRIVESGADYIPGEMSFNLFI